MGSVLQTFENTGVDEERFENENKFFECKRTRIDYIYVVFVLWVSVWQSYFPIILYAAQVKS